MTATIGVGATGIGAAATAASDPRPSLIPGLTVEQLATTPPEVIERILSIDRSPASTTARLEAAIEPLRALGVDETQISGHAYGRFPVAGPATFSHDWWFPRFSGGFHLHEGTDIFAAAGTPVRAPFDGTYTTTVTLIGGNNVYITRPDGTYVYIAHLDRFVDGLVEGQQVHTGDTVGYVGDSGNARGTPPHVHFELHPEGGPPVDPKSYLDDWVAEAEQVAADMVTAEVDRRERLHRVRATRPSPAIALLRPDRSDVFAAPRHPTVGMMLGQLAATLGRLVGQVGPPAEGD